MVILYFNYSKVIYGLIFSARIYGICALRAREGRYNTLYTYKGPIRDDDMDDGKIRVALYARVSLEDVGDEKRIQDPDNQLIPLRDWAKALNAEVVAEYIDRKSGADPNREEFRRMLNDAMQRKFNWILIWKLDRFSREGIISTMAYIQKLKARNVYIRSLTESWLDTSNEGMTDIVLAIMAWASAEERKKISERTRAGIIKRRAIGQWKGGRPKGSKDTKPRKKGGVVLRTIYEA